MEVDKWMGMLIAVAATCVKGSFLAWNFIRRSSTLRAVAGAQLVLMVSSSAPSDIRYLIVCRLIRTAVLFFLMPFMPFTFPTAGIGAVSASVSSLSCVS